MIVFVYHDIYSWNYIILLCILATTLSNAAIIFMFLKAHIDMDNSKC